MKAIRYFILLFVCATLSGCFTLQTSTPTDYSSVSGYTGSTIDINIGTNRNINEPERWAVTGFSVVEHWDQPCEFFMYGRELGETSGPEIIVGSVVIDNCNSPPPISLKTASFEAPRFVRGIKVCTTEKRQTSKDRLKGARIYSAEVNSIGDVTEETNSEKWERTNCEKWHTAEYCDNNEVAVGMRVHYRNKSARGIALKCAPVVRVDNN